MSVINNVLKSLESRASQFTPIEISALESASAALPERRPKLYLGVALLLVLAAAGYFLQEQLGALFAQPVSEVANLNQPVLPVAPAVVEAIAFEAEEPVLRVAEPLPAVAAALPGNQIVGLQIRESETGMRLEFALRERVVAYLRERGENSFGYHLRDVDSQIVAPLMRNNRWIHTLSIEKTESGVDVTIATADGILVETVQQPQDGESVWIIHLREAQAAAVVVQSAPAAVAPVAAAPVTAAVSPAPAVEAPPVAAAEPVAAPVKIEIKSINPVTKTTDQLDYAVELMNAGRVDEADSLLLGLFGGTHDYSARKHLLVLYSRSNRPARVRALLESSLQTYPQDPLLQTEFARVLYQSADYRNVIALFARNETLDASQQALMAASYQRLDQHQEAMHYYKLALLQDRENARNWVGLGISQEYSSEFEDALRSYQQAGKLGTLNARLRTFVRERSDKLQQVIN